MTFRQSSNEVSISGVVVGDTGVGYYDVQSAELFDRSVDEILDLLFRR